MSKRINLSTRYKFSLSSEEIREYLRVALQEVFEDQNENYGVALGETIYIDRG